LNTLAAQSKLCRTASGVAAARNNPAQFVEAEAEVDGTVALVLATAIAKTGSFLMICVIVALVEGSKGTRNNPSTVPTHAVPFPPHANAVSLLLLVDPLMSMILVVSQVVLSLQWSHCKVLDDARSKPEDSHADPKEGLTSILALAM
jgi:hypothetical protein